MPTDPQPFGFPWPYSALLFPELPVQTQLAATQTVLSPVAAISYGQHVGILYRTPADYAIHT